MSAIKAAVIGAGGLSAMVAVVAAVQMGSVAAENELKTEAVADANGNLHVPDAYRTTYQFLGTWAVAADPGQGSEELHVVYASPGTITAYRKDGHFPDGAVLVKEVCRAATGQVTTDTVSHANSLRELVMVKDSSGRSVGNDLRGDGWGLPTRQLPLSPSRSRGDAGQRRPTTERIANPVTCRRKRRTGSTLVGTRR